MGLNRIWTLLILQSAISPVDDLFLLNLIDIWDLKSKAGRLCNLTELNVTGVHFKWLILVAHSGMDNTRDDQCNIELFPYSFHYFTSKTDDNGIGYYLFSYDQFIESYKEGSYIVKSGFNFKYKPGYIPKPYLGTRPHIPRTLHLLDTAPIEEWKTLLPGWDVCVWTTKMTSYEIISRVGGYYVSSKIKPTSRLEFIASNFYWAYKIDFNNGIVGAIQGHRRLNPDSGPVTSVLEVMNLILPNEFLD